MGKHIPVAVGELRRNPLGYSNAWEQVEGVLATRGMQERRPEGGCWEGHLWPCPWSWSASATAKLRIGSVAPGLGGRF